MVSACIKKNKNTCFKARVSSSKSWTRRPDAIECMSDVDAFDVRIDRKQLPGEDQELTSKHNLKVLFEQHRK